MSGNKPEYRIPLMSEIKNIPWNGYNVVSTFSGGGGSCLGYRMAGYKVLWANEFVEEAQKTYIANHEGTYLDTRDIREITANDILEQICMKPGEIDILDGPPPCCAFSMAGRREKSWNQKREYSDGKVQQIENLFFEYIRILRGLQPKCFIAENVSGLVSGKAIGWFKEFIQYMNEAGYRVKASKINSKYLGVPESRERVIFLGVRNDIGIDPIFPKPLPYIYTLGEAISTVKNDKEEVKMLTEYMKRTKQGKVLSLLQKDPNKSISADKIMNGSWFSFKRESMYATCSTLTATGCKVAAAGSCHPLEDRKFTIAEMKRITSLPDDFILTGNRDQQGERVGRMVPPVMMMHIAKTVQNEILEKMETNHG